MAIFHFAHIRGRMCATFGIAAGVAEMISYDKYFDDRLSCRLPRGRRLVWRYHAAHKRILLNYIDHNVNRQPTQLKPSRVFSYYNIRTAAVQCTHRRTLYTQPPWTRSHAFVSWSSAFDCRGPEFSGSCCLYYGTYVSIRLNTDDTYITYLVFFDRTQKYKRAHIAQNTYVKFTSFALLHFIGTEMCYRKITTHSLSNVV